MNRDGKFHQNGFSLIEMLIAVVILGGALIALASFQGSLLRGGGEAKAKSMAMNLAQQKIDDLRSFHWLDVDSAQASGAADCGTAGACYTEIGNNAGGLEDGAGNLLMPSGAMALADATVAYNLSWVATDYYFAPNGALGPASPTSDPNDNGNCPCPYVVAADWDAGWGDVPDESHYKATTVTVSWDDESGASQSVSLQGNISGTDIRMAARVAVTELDGAAPIVTHTPSGETPDVVPISVGGGRQKETSKPEPEVFQTGQQDSVVVSFDVVTYDAATMGAEKREEFYTVSCNCELGAENGTGNTVSRAGWLNGILVDNVGAPVTKRIGSYEVASGGIEKELCDVCCRDHHDTDTGDYACDPNGSTEAEQFNCYDMNRSSSEYGADGDHYHYAKADLLDGSVDVGDSPVAEGETYFEACRLKRTDGYLRVFSDWNLVDTSAFSYGYLTSSAATFNAYTDYVENVVQHEVDPGVSLSSLTVSTTTLIPAGIEQALSRSVYVDQMKADHKTAVAALDQATWLDYVPFYEVNTTMLYDWSSSDAGVATVTNEAIVTIDDPVTAYYDGNYSRGLIAGVAAGTADINVQGMQGSAGLTGTYPLYDVSPLTTTMPVEVAAAGNTYVVSGRLVNAETGPAANTVKDSTVAVAISTATGTGTVQAASCTVGGYVNGGKYFPYTCAVVVNAGATGVDITITPGPDATLDFHYQADLPGISKTHTINDIDVGYDPATYSDTEHFDTYLD